MKFTPGELVVTIYGGGLMRVTRVTDTKVYCNLLVAPWKTSHPFDPRVLRAAPGDGSDG